LNPAACAIIRQPIRRPGEVQVTGYLKSKGRAAPGLKVKVVVRLVPHNHCFDV
jgi:hypothetical protein